MKEEKKTEIKVGLTVLIGLILLIWIFGWAKNFTFSSQEREVTVEFDNVAGLNLGDQVSVKGIKKGYVSDVYISKNSALVKLLLDNDIDLREDATFSLMVLDLMGGKKVEIDPGIGVEPFDYSLQHRGYFLGDISTTMAMLGSVQDDLVKVIIEVKNSLNSLNKLIVDTEFTDELHKGISSLNQLISKTDKLISDNNRSINELLSNSNELVVNSNNFIMDNKNDLSDAIDNLNLLLNDSDTLVIRLSKFIYEIENKNNNIGKLAYDETLIQDLKLTLLQLKELSELVLEQIKGKGFKVDADIF